MPRIPVRVEPYSSPHLRQRHFKSKRDSILRALGTASYINGSHFAILWVNSRGEAEHYASELFQPKLNTWFSSEVVLQARQMVMAAIDVPAPQDSGLAQIVEADLEHDEARTEGEEEEGLDQMEQMNADTLMTWDPKGDMAMQDRRHSQSSQLAGQGPPLDFATTLKQRVHAPILRRTFSMPNPVHGRAQSVGELPSMKMTQQGNRPPALDLNAVREDEKFHVPRGSATSSNPEYKALTIGNHDEVTAFLETRFRQLQQLVCKIVAKAWIKVIEPKKQTRYPYNKGDESKPTWWPENARHKEPDHLMKPERISLLMTMLRCGKVPANRLELATAEVAAFIPPDKINLLREIYRVAREEERFRCNDISGDTRIFVAATAVVNPATDDLNSPMSANMRLVDDLGLRSAPLHDTPMDLQRSTSHETPQFDEHDPFAEAGDMQQGYAMLPPQNFYYGNASPAFAEHASAAVMNNPNNLGVQHSAVTNMTGSRNFSNQQFQQAQQHQMFLAQQAHNNRRSNEANMGGVQASFVQNPWPQNIGQSWPQSAEVYQQGPVENHSMQQAQLPLQASSHNNFYPHPPVMETPAKQTQQTRSDQQSLRSSPYLPTPLRPNLEGTFSAPRNQGVSFSDYLHSPRTALPGGLHEEDHGLDMKDEYPH